MEYMALGDYQTAVGFLLAAAPERSARYYRDALCALALAAAAVTGDPTGANAVSASRTLLVQAAKVPQLMLCITEPTTWTSRLVNGISAGLSQYHRPAEGEVWCQVEAFMQQGTWLLRMPEGFAALWPAYSWRITAMAVWPN